MGARSGPALKTLQWLLRGLQLLSAALILGIYSYFLAALANHGLRTPNPVRAVEGIAGAAVLYTLLALLLLCCLAGRTLTALLAVVLDVAFLAAFIYVAVANRAGAGSCSGYLDTPFGRGQGGDVAEGSDGFTVLPSFRVACRLQTACLSVSIVIIFLFIFSILTEVFLARHHRKEKRFGPSPNNNYTSGYGSSPASVSGGGDGSGGSGGLFSRLLSRRSNKKPIEEEDNVLPAHTTPGQLDGARSSYTGPDHLSMTNDQYHGGTADPYDPPNQYSSYHGAGGVAGGGHDMVETGYGYPAGRAPAGYQAAPPQDYRYEDGTYDRA